MSQSITGMQLWVTASGLQGEVCPWASGRTSPEDPPTGPTGTPNATSAKPTPPPTLQPAPCVRSQVYSTTGKWSALRKADQGLWTRKKPQT